MPSPFDANQCESKQNYVQREMDIAKERLHQLEATVPTLDAICEKAEKELDLLDLNG
ncbi:hypothetical protein NHH03_16375 [Stieleria sp. TO1_6]|uniref:hypothetical protein n=1 Tax=Stieleria tagensis TaxID=2956795 RepID=UPI00209B840F|nr:hypothetical protein [Stieleria tagensis]MCO8123327.1 hypothetical protein [Stieleria tagensis]